MRIKSAVPPSRLNKKQVISYLSSEQFHAVLQKARDEGITNQEILAQAINTALSKYGIEPVLTVKHDRVFHRSPKKAAAKRETYTSENGKDIIVPSCRTGRHGLGGWFLISEVETLVGYSEALTIPIQRLAETGLAELTGIEKPERVKKKRE